ncbi:MAG: arginine N-succinyltransferase, partial [Bdellovibrio sp.]
MSFLVRPAQSADLKGLYDLAKQFTLLNLPADRKILAGKLDTSEKAFAGELEKAEAEYLFVLEDLEENQLVGSSLIMAKHGTEEIPHHYLKLVRKNHYSEDLGIGFIHQVIRFQMDTDGPTEIGGLLVDRSYRRRPEKLGKQVSLSRFLYMALFPDRFEDRVLCELAPPLTEDGRSEFWEALGRRFTGLPYQEADVLSQNHKEFIGSLFPSEDIYVCLLDSKARLVIGRVGQETRAAEHLLKSIGFRYLEEVDPFDGGPHFGADFRDILPIRQAQRFRVASAAQSSFPKQGLVSRTQGEFRCALVSYLLHEGEISLSSKSMDLLRVQKGDEVIMSPFHYPS